MSAAVQNVALHEGLYAECLSIADVSTQLAGDMFSLFSKYYDAIDEQRFYSDLSNKSHVFILRDSDKDDKLCGFSTVVHYYAKYEGRSVRAVFSGDTIVAREYWGEQTLATAFSTYCGERYQEEPDTPLYWLLISKGHRTFRLLSLFARSYYPNPARETPSYERGLIAALATERFGAEDFDAERGILHFQESLGQLKPQFADVQDHVKDKPAVQLFLKMNPNFENGDELVCVARLHPENVLRHAKRAFIAGMENISQQTYEEAPVVFYRDTGF